MIELTFQKTLMLIRPITQKNVLIAAIDIFYTKSLGFNQMSAMSSMMY